MLPGGGFYWLKNRTWFPLVCQFRNSWSILQILVIIKFKVEMCLHGKSEKGPSISVMFRGQLEDEIKDSFSLCTSVCQLMETFMYSSTKTFLS